MIPLHDPRVTPPHIHHPYVPRPCGAALDEHPREGWVRFEWAETARPAGWWYYRTADLQSESVLWRDHRFVSERGHTAMNRSQ